MNERKPCFDSVLPLDRLANEFLLYLVHSEAFSFYIDQTYIQWGIDYAAKTAKVLRCTPRFWSWLGRVRAEETHDTSSGEYARKMAEEDWESPTGIDGFSVQTSIGTDPESGKVSWIPAQLRSTNRFFRQFPFGTVAQLATYDALVFLRTDKHQGAEGALYRCYVCAHECYDLMTDLVVQLSGEPREKWDPEAPSINDPALYHFNKFGEGLTENHKSSFMSQPQADEIDL